MEKENQENEFPGEEDTGSEMQRALSADENLKRNIEKLHQFASTQSSLKSVSEEMFKASCATKSSSFASMAIMGEQTTGGNEEPNKRDSKVSLTSDSSACSFTTRTSMQQQGFQQQQQSSIVSSTTSSCAKSTLRKSKTLSFLHNEDLFSDKALGKIQTGSNNINALQNYEKLTAQLQQVQKKVSQSQSTSNDVGGENLDNRILRKMAILSPKHSLQELNERIVQRMSIQQQVFHGTSSQLSL